jgi:hypothetical protein
MTSGGSEAGVYTKNLSANTPLYGQQVCDWCGAASGQMARNGYPNPADRLLYVQGDVWNMIQARNSTTPADSGWATDAHGLTATLQDMNNPAGVHWVEFSGARDVVLFDILYWMNNREYPSPVLINQGGHWVVIVGWVTDIVPTLGSSPTLQSITVNDPEPHNVGTLSTFTGAQWFSGPWNGAVKYAGTWFGKYVAVVEPPIQEGKIRVERADRVGTQVIPAQEAVERARRILAEMDASEQPGHAALLRGAEPHEALLIREENPVGRRAKNIPQYYIVPFGFPDERHQRGGRLVRGSVLVNAFTGDLEEVTTFGAPIRYLTQDEALDVVASAVRLDPERLRDAEVRLMFSPGDISHIRAYPFWSIKIGRRTLYVDQLGKLYGKFLESIPGD